MPTLYCFQYEKPTWPGDLKATSTSSSSYRMHNSRQPSIRDPTHAGTKTLVCKYSAYHLPYLLLNQFDCPSLVNSVPDSFFIGMRIGSVFGVCQSTHLNAHLQSQHDQKVITIVTIMLSCVVYITWLLLWYMHSVCQIGYIRDITLLTMLHFYISSEIGAFDTGLIIELWDKGMLWDKVIGYHWAPLQHLQSKVVRHQSLITPLSSSSL